jgi:hypothetical protein
MPRTRKRLRRPGQEPPKRMSDIELEKARPDQVEKKIREHARFFEHLDRRPDPGSGLSPLQAAPARERHLAELDGQLNEIDRLETALAPISAEEKRRLSPKTLLFNRRAVERAPRSEEERKSLAEMYAGMRKQEAAREARKKLAKLKEKRQSPPDPRAESIIGALFADDFLYDGLRRITRENVEVVGDFGHRQTVTATDVLFDLEDVGIALALLHLLEETGSVLIRDAAMNGLWPEGSALPPVQGLARRVRHLAANGIFALSRDGGTLRVRYGPRTVEIAAQYGIRVEVAEKEAVTA